MAKIKIDNELIDILRSEDGSLHIDNVKVEHDLIQVSNQEYHLLLNNKSYTILVDDIDQATGDLKITVNGRSFDAKLSYKIEQLLKSMGMETGKKVQKDVKAPMPGLVLNVLVEEGQEVNEGDDLVILEAMKMENALKAPQSGVIGAVSVTQQDKVDKNQVLVSYQ